VVRYQGSKWFNEVAEGADLKARLIPSNYLMGNEYESIRCTRLHRMQKTGDETEEVQDTAEGVLKKASTKYPTRTGLYSTGRTAKEKSRGINRSSWKPVVASAAKKAWFQMVVLAFYRTFWHQMVSMNQA